MAMYLAKGTWTYKRIAVDLSGKRVEVKLLLNRSEGTAVRLLDQPDRRSAWSPRRTYPSVFPESMNYSRIVHAMH